jgi:hypothetical protein
VGHCLFPGKNVTPFSKGFMIKRKKIKDLEMK